MVSPNPFPVRTVSNFKHCVQTNVGSAKMSNSSRAILFQDTARYRVRRSVKPKLYRYDENKGQAPEIYSYPNSDSGDSIYETSSSFEDTDENTLNHALNISNNTDKSENNGPLRLHYGIDNTMKLRRRSHVSWGGISPQRTLIVKKRNTAKATEALKTIGFWLKEKNIDVLVEESVKAEECPEFEKFESDMTQSVDFCVTLGGDGTVLHLASLFEHDEPLPPVLSFAMGTVGFLTPFDIKGFKSILERVLNAKGQPLVCTLRARKRCDVYARGQFSAVHHVLNECIIDRGGSQCTVTVEIFIDGNYVTTVTADGLIIATPSGSTAYSMTAGGPMVAPSVPCTIITPVAPFSLSFRPLVIPETSDIIVKVSEHSKSVARASFDGRHEIRLGRGASVHLTTSLCPLPLVNMGQLDTDWYEGITQKLKWNQSIVDPPSKPAEVPVPTRWTDLI